MSNLERLDKNIRAFLKALQKVVTAQDKRRLNLNGQPNMVLSCLNKYTKAYELSCRNDPNGALNHLDDFARVYKHYRSSILKSEVGWLKLGNVSVTFGEGIPGVRRDIRIMLSEIYEQACDLKACAEYRLEGLPDKEWEACEELNFPDIVLLYLYRIFRDVCPEDADVLGKSIANIESDLGIADAGGSELNLGGIEKLISPLLSTLSKATSEGEGLGDIGSIFSKLDLNSLVSNLTSSLQDSNVQNSISSTLNQLQGNPEIGRLFNSVSKAFEPNAAIGPPSLAIPTNTLQTTALSALQHSEKKLINSKEESFI